ncbi:hypothetical protein QJS10_CPA03g01751 [Acorus calamus]|uniref:Mitochondrial proton/calcium exchanger protein n=1 Tax=Acorus calamus TaxID=4465 RepID=A0AAV9F8C7_ACOCL|nr:hypothetical protein QJS10_CPA03g01751 [Acorus calamus]
MASRAILRRRKIFFENTNSPSRLVQYFSGFGSGRSTSDDDPGVRTCETPLTHKEGLFGFSSPGFLRRPSHGMLLYGSASGRYDLILPLGARWIAQPMRTASTVTAGQPVRGGDGPHEEKHPKQVKEASPEECDQAVEGLSTAKAKAKAKQLKETQRGVKSVMQKFWAMLLGVGPALRAVASMSRADWAVKLSHWKDEFVSALKHYWAGTKLLWVDVRISVRLLWKLVKGKSLSRRERQQLTRTTADIFRLVPFAVFIIVPFMEFLLPVFLKLFPNMLPSTFQDKMKEQEALKKRINARIEYAKFLQDTVKEMAKEVKGSRSGEIQKTAEDLDEFMNKVRKGGRVSNDEILNFAKLFNDELTLDNISRPRLISMCKYMGIKPYGTDSYLRYQLRNKLAMIKNDDKMIQAEGVESLSEPELRQACRDRGYLGLLSVEEMRHELRDWLDLSLNHALPSSLLILSRAFSVSGKLRPEQAVQATLSSLPDEVVETVGATALPSEDSLAEKKRKLEFLEMQEELIKEEEEREQEQAKMETAISQEDVALREMTSPVREKLAEEKMMDKKEELCRISRALAVLASASSVSREREEFLSLVNKEIGLYNSMLEKEGTDGEEEAKKAYLAAREKSEHADETDDRVSSALIERVDKMLQKLEKEIDDVDAAIGDRWRILDRDHDGKVTPEEVAAAAAYLKDTIDKDGIQDLISNLSKDKDGKILVEDIVKLAAEAEDTDTAEERRS